MSRDKFDEFCSLFFKTKNPEKLVYYQGLSLLLYAITIPNGLKYI